MRNERRKDITWKGRIETAASERENQGETMTVRKDAQIEGFEKEKSGKRREGGIE